MSLITDDSPHPAADLAEITRIYGIRHWIEQSYKQVKDELGWSGFQVRSDLAIRRHQALVNCAFSFCWDAWLSDHPVQHQPAAPRSGPSRGERGATRRRPPAPTTAAAGPDQLGRGRLQPAPLHPKLANYR